MSFMPWEECSRDETPREGGSAARMQTPRQRDFSMGPRQARRWEPTMEASTGLTAKITTMNGAI